MSDPGPLLVPVAVDAWVLSSQTIRHYATTASSTRARMNYGELASYQTPVPGPFQQDDARFLDNTANHGVYLMWTLPAALRHGTQDATGAIAFPLIPNRWLVVRLLRPQSASPAAAPALTAWVVQADALGESDGSPYVDPHAQTLTPALVGHRVEISAASPWQEPARTGASFLRAVAEANPAFAAYQPFNQNVLSIHDDLLTQGVGDATVSYQVVGWYSEPSDDALAGWQEGVAGEDFPDLLARLGWSASDAGAGTRTSLYHGAAHGVPWQPDGSAQPPATPAMQVAVANTSVDAVVAFAEAAVAATPPPNMSPQEAADLLQAFQYNLLPMLGQAGAEQMLQDRIRDHWFSSVPGGTSWTIVDAEQPAGAPPAAPPSSGELAAEATWLAALNAAQSQLDGATRELVGARRRLLELWWKSGLANAYVGETGKWPWGIASGEVLQQALAAAATTVQGLMETIGGLLAQVPAPTAGQTLDDAIAAFAAVKSLPASRQLKAVSLAPFYAPVDPVMVVSGTQHGTEIERDATLACRWPAELVTELSVTTGGGPTFTISSSQLASQLPAGPWSGLPASVEGLYAEGFLLDPANAALAAAAAGQTLDATQTAALAASIATPRPATGTAPAVLPAWPWAQPWLPLYVDWGVEWLPVPFMSGATPNWQFDGADYQISANAQAGAAQPLSGRSLLTPKPSFELKARIDQFTSENPQSPATGQLEQIEALLQVDGWDFVSQAFSGLTAQVSYWDTAPVESPDDAQAVLPGSALTMAQLLGDAVDAPPQNLMTSPGTRPHPAPPSDFEGMRAGQLYFTGLRIVDAFGQSLDIVTQQTSTTFHPLLGDGVATTHGVTTLDPARVVQLPPRLLQPARLDFAFAGPGGGNPIAGWVLPNHLDEGLAAYGADGSALGELHPATGASGPYVVWAPAPNGPSSPAQLSGVEAPLGGFLAALQAAGPDAFSAFIAAVDETLWTVDPLGARTDAFLSVMLGRPLAVASASLALELQSSAYADPRWPYTLQSPPAYGAFTGHAFDVRLGDLGYRQDGLLGYFLDGDYTRFHAVHVPTANSYLEPVAPGAYVQVKPAVNGPGPARALTLLLDPRAAVHAACGLLPTTTLSLAPGWVDASLSAMAASFRTGPALVSEQLDPSGARSLALTAPAERHGTWSWTERQSSGAWTAPQPLAPVSAAAAFPNVPPTLREGLLNLTGGLDE